MSLFVACINIIKRCVDVCMSKQLLNLLNVHSTACKTRCKRSAESVRVNIVNFGSFSKCFQNVPNSARVKQFFVDVDK